MNWVFYVWAWKYFFSFIVTSVAYVVGLGVNPLQNWEIQHVNIVLQCMIDFLNNQIWKEIMIELNGTP